MYETLAIIAKFLNENGIQANILQDQLLIEIPQEQANIYIIHEPKIHTATEIDIGYVFTPHARVDMGDPKSFSKILKAVKHYRDQQAAETNQS